MKLTLIAVACAVALSSAGAFAATAKASAQPEAIAGRVSGWLSTTNTFGSSNWLAFSPITVGTADFGNSVLATQPAGWQAAPLAAPANWGLPAKGAAQGIRVMDRFTSTQEPDTLMMLLTGLGVMGSIARRRRLAKKSA